MFKALSFRFFRRHLNFCFYVCFIFFCVGCSESWTLRFLIIRLLGCSVLLAFVPGFKFEPYPHLVFELSHLFMLDLKIEPEPWPVRLTDVRSVPIFP